MEKRNSKDSSFMINQIKDKIFFVIMIIFSFLVVVPLIWILGFLIVQGLKYFNWTLLTHNPVPPGEEGGGIFNAIIGSGLIVLCSSIIAVPIGIMAGIYLSENKYGIIPNIVRVTVDVLQGIPSIVIGIIGFTWIVVPLKSYSGFAGSVALAIMMLPVIIKNTEETLKLIPMSLKEAAYALGVPYHKVMMRIIVPAGLSGVVTGVIVAVSRILGETAPLLFTALGNTFLSLDMTKPMHAIPLIIYKYAASPYDTWNNIAWGASFFLVLSVLSLNLISKVVVSRWKVKF